MKEKMTQTKAIENHLFKYKKISSKEAFKKYGVTRLSGLIFNLRKKYTITTEYKTIKNRYGNTTNYAVYTLVKGSKEV